MAHEVVWTKVIVDEFVKEAMLSENEEMVLRTRAKGWSRLQQADALHTSIATVDRIISTLRIKYDRVQKYDVLLPPREKLSEYIKGK